MIANEENEKRETATRDPSRRVAMGVGLAAAIAVVAGLAKLATSTASAAPAKRKTGGSGSGDEGSSTGRKKTGTPERKFQSKANAPNGIPLPKAGRAPLVGSAPLKPAKF